MLSRRSARSRTTITAPRSDASAGPGEALIAIDHFLRALALKPDRENRTAPRLALLQLNRPATPRPAAAGDREIPDRDGPAQQPRDGADPARPFDEAVLVLRRVGAHERNLVARANLGRPSRDWRYDEGHHGVSPAAEQQPFAPEPRIGFVLAYRDTGRCREMRSTSRSSATASLGGREIVAGIISEMALTVVVLFAWSSAAS